MWPSSLRQAGHEVSLVRKALGMRTDDVDIGDHAVRAGAMVITCNRDDFLALAGTEPKTGLVILNRRRTRQAECRHVLQLLAEAGESGLMGNINFA